MPAKRKSAKRKPARSKVTFVDPYIRVKNVTRSADWYERMLGLQIEMAVPDKKNPAMVRMNAGNPDGVALMIGDGSDPMSGRKAPASITSAMSARKAQKVVSFYFRVDKNIDALFESAKRKRAKIDQPIMNMDYGMREFSMRDPDGYLVSVGQARAVRQPAAKPKRRTAAKRRK